MGLGLSLPTYAETQIPSHDMTFSHFRALVTGPDGDEIRKEFVTLGTLLYQYGDRSPNRIGENGPERPSELLTQWGLRLWKPTPSPFPIESNTSEASSSQQSLPEELRDPTPARVRFLRLLRRKAEHVYSDINPAASFFDSSTRVLSDENRARVNAFIEGSETLLHHYHTQIEGRATQLTPEERNRIRQLMRFLKFAGVSDWTDDVIENLVITPYGGLTESTSTDSGLFRISPEAQVGIGAIVSPQVQVGARTLITNTRLLSNPQRISLGTDCFIDGFAGPRNATLRIGDRVKIKKTWFNFLTVSSAVNVGTESVLTEVNISGNIDQLELKSRNQLRSIFLQLSHSRYELFNEKDRELRLSWVMEPGAKVSQLSGDLLAYRSAWNFSWRTQSIDERPIHTLHFLEDASIAPPDSQVAPPERNGSASLCPTPGRYQRPGRERTSAVVFQSRPRNEHTTRLRQWSDLSDRCQYRWVERIQ
jgi:hypothetical protein